jgi:antitoxin (DNA-binding transcriptional repressor) of toxin-antitoxin stability system
MYIKYMKTITVKDLKANWTKIEEQVRAGETFEVLNRGRVAAHVVPATPRQVLRWPDHLATAYKNTGRKGSDIVSEHREGRG